MNWLTKAATAGHVRAQVSLGHLYAAGDRTRKVAPEDGGGYEGVNLGESVKWFRCAAEQGNAEAQYEVGFAYLYAAGVEHEDPREAVKWLTKAAEQGHDGAQFALADIYYHGEVCANTDEIKPDLQASLHWARKAAEQGHEGAKKLLGHFLRMAILQQVERQCKEDYPIGQWVRDTFGEVAMGCLWLPFDED
jgi:TPR repeat protein